MTAGRLIDDVVGIERRSVLLLFLALVPILGCLALWSSQPGGERIYLGNVASAFVDRGGQLTISDVMEGSGELFAGPTGKTPNLGVRASQADAFWVRVPLDVATGSTEEMALSFEEPRFRRVDLFLFDGQGSLIRQQSFTRDATTRYRFPVFFLPAQGVEGAIAYARIFTGSSMRGTVYLSEASAFEAINARAIASFALLLGAMSASAIYLLALGGVLRNATYATLGVAVVAAGVYIASDQALLETYFLPGANTLARVASMPSTTVFYAAFLSFSTRFMRFGPHSASIRKWIDRLALALLALALAAFLSSLADAPIMRRYLPYVGLGAATVLIGLVLACARHAVWRALMFLLMWLPLVVTGLSRILLDAASGPTGPLALNGIYFGLAISLLLFTIVTPLELYRRERSLRRHTQSLLGRLESFARIGNDIYFETDPEGRVVYLSGNGIPAHQPEEELTLDRATTPNLPQQALEMVAASRDATSPISNQIFPVEALAGRRWFSITGEPADEVGNFRAIVRDVTAAVEQEQQRNQERHLITLGSLAAAVAHELNNVVQPIINMSKGLRDHTRDRPAAERMLDLIDIASQQAVRLVSQILRLGARGVDQAGAPRHPLDRAVHDAVDTLRLFLPAGVKLEARIEPVADVTVRSGDILQILINLGANAHRASNGSGTIEIELAPSPEGARLTVADQGTGMDETTRQRALEPGFTTKPPGRAAGIGLGVVRGLVDEYRGQLFVDSLEGRGTRITLVLPRDDGESA